MSKFDELYPFMNEFEQHITDLYSLENIVDAINLAVESANTDRTMNLLIGLKEMIRYHSDILHNDFTKAWKEFMIPEHVTKTWTTNVVEIEREGDCIVTIPDHILDELGWGEGDVLSITTLRDGTIRVVRDEIADTGEGAGCMGDDLTDEELQILKKGGVLGLKAPWS